MIKNTPTIVGVIVKVYRKKMEKSFFWSIFNKFYILSLLGLLINTFTVKKIPQYHLNSAKQ